MGPVGGIRSGAEYQCASRLVSVAGGDAGAHLNGSAALCGNSAAHWVIAAVGGVGSAGVGCGLKRRPERPGVVLPRRCWGGRCRFRRCAGGGGGLGQASVERHVGGLAGAKYASVRAV